jgi:hypothetical protein
LSWLVKAEQLAILINQDGAFLPLSLLGLGRPSPRPLAGAWLQRDQLTGIGRREEWLLLIKLNGLKLNCPLSLNDPTLLGQCRQAAQYKTHA